MRALTALFLFLFCACFLEAPRMLSFEEEIASRSLISKQPLPSSLLDNLSKAVEFALLSGAAREISQQDLFHAHLLFARGNRNLLSPDAILLHAQEMVVWSPEEFKKRNVLISLAGQPEILDCSRGLSRRRFFPQAEWPTLCVVDEHDLGLTNPADVYIVRVDRISKALARSLGHNTRSVRGLKVLFVGFGLTLKNGRLALP